MRLLPTLSLFSIVLIGAPSVVMADDLSPAQIEGRRLVNQSCAVCHLPVQLGAKTYGPSLNRDSLGGQADVLREVISNGTPRMPGFRHHFKPAQIDAIIAFITSVPSAPKATPANAVAR